MNYLLFQLPVLYHNENNNLHVGLCNIPYNPSLTKRTRRFSQMRTRFSAAGSTSHIFMERESHSAKVLVLDMLCIFQKELKYNFSPLNISMFIFSLSIFFIPFSLPFFKKVSFLVPVVFFKFKKYF